MKNIIWRDDDVGADTKLETLQAVDDVFQMHKKRHTIAVIAAGLYERPDLINLIRERSMLVQLHCWQHDDLSQDQAARLELERAVDLLERLFNRPTVLYPPWNRTSPELEETAARLGLTISTEKISLSQYVRHSGDVSENVVNFHHWHVPDAILLDRALAL